MKFEEIVRASEVSITSNRAYHGYIDLKEFYDLVVEDIMRVVAAHALSGDIAIDVFTNLQKLYQNEKTSMG